jgi:RNA polymerase sigma factor (sigma-70 family)
VNSLTDQQLLRDYAGQRSEAAFAELVSRHVDLVYSAAWRLVRDRHLAEDVTQGVFVALTRSAPQLTDRSVLSGWLHRTAQNLAANTIRSDARRRTREQEAAAMNELLATEPASVWEHIAPHLDAALGELSEPDRDAVLLRYFERKSAREMAGILGTSEEAAQKRVSRAVERLREFFAQRGVTVGASGLVAVLSANAVQAAPVELAVTISAAVLAGTAVSTATAIVATKAIAMTTLQKTAVAATVAVLAGAGIYEAHQASHLREQNQTLQQQQAPLTEQVQRLQRERDDATNRLAGLQEDYARLKSNPDQSELLRLRGEVGRLRQQLVDRAAHPDSPSNGLAALMRDPAMKEYMRQQTLNYVASSHNGLIRELHLTAEQKDQFIKIVGEAGFKVAEAFSTQNRAAFEQARSGIKDDAESQLKSLLGDAGLARCKEFNDEIPARATLDLLNDELGSNPITEVQRASLLQIIKAEPWNLTHGIWGEVDGAFLGSPEEVAAYLQRVAESNQHILQQAGDILNPDQLAALNTVLTNGINTRKVYGQALVQKR